MRMFCGIFCVMFTLAVTGAMGGEVTYDPAGNVLTQTDVTGSTRNVTSYTYSDTNRLLTVSLNGKLIVTYTYDSADNRIGVRHADGTSCAYTWGAFDDLTSMEFVGKTVTLTYARPKR